MPSDEEKHMASGIYHEPRRMYFRHVNDIHGERIESWTVVGETSRSWLTGPSWDRFRLSKKEHIPVSEREYNDCEWARRNVSKIARQIYNYSLGVPVDTLRKIAELIGYKEDPENA